MIYAIYDFVAGQGGHPPGPAEADFRRQAVGGRQDPVRLQHPEGVHPSPGPEAEGRHGQGGLHQPDQEAGRPILALCNSLFP